MGLSTLYLLGAEFEAVFKEIRKRKVRHWEIFDDGLHRLDVVRTRKLVRLASQYGLSYSVHAPICDLNLASLNTEISSIVLERMRMSLQYASMLGANVWVIHPGTHGALSWVLPGEDWRANEKNMRLLQAIGRKLGVEVVVENISASLAILGRVRDFRRLYSEWKGAPGITLDVGHSHMKGETSLFLTSLAHRLKHVHAHDNHGDFDKHLAAGSGGVKWKSVLAGLVKSGFEGRIVVESVKGPSASLARIRKLLGSLQ